MTFLADFRLEACLCRKYDVARLFSLGAFEIQCIFLRLFFQQINNSERFPVRCRLRHFTKIYSNRIVLPPDHDCVPSEPIFPDQKELLDSIPLPIHVPEEKFT